MKDISATVGRSFRARADSAAFFEAWVGSQLSRSGLYTLHHPFTLLEETGFTKSHYAHSWDLSVVSRADAWAISETVPTEVKAISLRFNHRADYPHEGVLVCSKLSWDRKKWGQVTGRDFLLVSMATGAVVWLPNSTRAAPVTITDKTRGETYQAMAAHKSELRNLEDFVAMVKEQ